MVDASLQPSLLAGHVWHGSAASCSLFAMHGVHAAGRDPDRPAMVWADEAAPHVVHSMSLGQLALRSAHIADALRAAGFQPGGCITHSAPHRPTQCAVQHISLTGYAPPFRHTTSAHASVCLLPRMLQATALRCTCR